MPQNQPEGFSDLLRKAIKIDDEQKKNLGQKLNSTHAQNLCNRQIKIEVEKERVRYEKMYEEIFSKKLERIDSLEAQVKKLKFCLAEKDDVISQMQMQLQIQQLEFNDERDSYETKLLEI